MEAPLVTHLASQPAAGEPSGKRVANMIIKTSYLSSTFVFRSAVGREGVMRGDMSKLGLPNTIRDYLNYL